MSPRAMRYGLIAAALTWIVLCTGACALLWVIR